MSDPNDAVKRELDAHRAAHPEHYGSDGKHLDTCAEVAANIEESEKAGAYDALVDMGKALGLGPAKKKDHTQDDAKREAVRAAPTVAEKLRIYGEGAPGKYVVNPAPKPKSNVRTREQDEFMSVEKKARESKRQCRARVSLPSRDGKTLVSFECTSHADHGLQYHEEQGRVRLRNNRTYEYRATWREVTETEVWRIEEGSDPQ